MKQRIKEIMTELYEAHLDFIESRAESERGYFTLGYNTLFSESVSCYRGEQAGKSRFNQSKETTTKEKQPITEKQSNYIKKFKEELKEMGVDVENIQYKDQATKIISEHIKSK